MAKDAWPERSVAELRCATKRVDVFFARVFLTDAGPQPLQPRSYRISAMAIFGISFNHCVLPWLSFVVRLGHGIVRPFFIFVGLQCDIF